MNKAFSYILQRSALELLIVLCGQVGGNTTLTALRNETAIP